MRYNKNRFALLAGIDGRDQYFGKTLRENYSFGVTSEAEDDLDAAEDEAAEDAPIDVEGEPAAEEGAEEMVSKEDVAVALSDILGVDSEELTALVSADEEAGEEDLDAEEGEEGEEGEELELELESRLRKAIRSEISSVIKEAHKKNMEAKIRSARRRKSVAVAMGYKK